MTPASLISAVKAKPEVRTLLLPTVEGGLGLTDNELTGMVSEHVSAAVSEVALSYTWDFLMKETTDVTVADQSDYELQGSDKDCLQIATVKYDTGETLLLKKTFAWLDDYLIRNAVSTPKYWLESGRAHGFPKIRIVATPDTAGKQLKYRYWRNQIDLSMFSGLFDFLFESALAKRLIPAYAGIFERELKRAISAYTRSGGETNLTVLDPEITLANKRRSALHGWSGT